MSRFASDGFSSLRSVVIVEDDASDAFLTAHTLGGLGVDDITVYATAEEALAGLRRMTTPPSVVLVDVNLPGMDGLELIGRLRAAGCDDLRLVLLFASRWDEERFAQRAVLADGWLAKPLAEEELLSMMSRLDRRPSFPRRDAA